MRIVSLVPSLTELVLDLGLEKELIGRTKFCIHPKVKVQNIAKIGGTKNANIEAIINLNPDLILANKEENARDDIETLMVSLNVHVTDISNYKEALQAIKDIGDLTDRTREAKELISTIGKKFADISDLSTKQKKVCYLIWNDPMMTVGKDTFIHDMLSKCRFENIYGDQKRYPTISIKEIKDRKPHYIFLSSEPFPFKEKHIIVYEKLFPESKIVIVDGEYFSWYGSRMSKATDYFKQLMIDLK